MIVKIVATKEGVWQNIYRPWNVLKTDAIWLLGKPVTVDHPHEGVNAGTFFVGQIKNVEADEENKQILCEAELWEEKIPSEILNRIKNNEQMDVSVGFYTVTEPISGEYDGKIYTAVEKKIYFDHLAIVFKGECSLENGCGLRMMNKGCNKKKNIKQVSNMEQMKKIYIVPTISYKDGQLYVHAEEAEELPQNLEQNLEQNIMKILEEIRADLLVQIQNLAEQNAQLTEALKKLGEEKSAIEEEIKEELLTEAAKFVPDVSVYKNLDRGTLRTIITHMKEISIVSSEKTPIVLPEKKTAPFSLEEIHNQFDKMLGRKK